VIKPGEPGRPGFRLEAGMTAKKGRPSKGSTGFQGGWVGSGITDAGCGGTPHGTKSREVLIRAHCIPETYLMYVAGM